MNIRRVTKFADAGIGGEAGCMLAVGAGFCSEVSTTASVQTEANALYW